MNSAVIISSILSRSSKLDVPGTVMSRHSNRLVFRFQNTFYTNSLLQQLTTTLTSLF